MSSDKEIELWERKGCAYGNKDVDRADRIFEKRSVKIAEIYDVKLSGEITDVHEDLVSSTVKAIGERNELEGGGTGTS